MIQWLMIIMEIFCGYFWSNVLKMDDAEEDIIKKINIKMIQGLKS